MTHHKKRKRDNGNLIAILFAFAGAGFFALMITHGLSIARKQDETREINQIAKHFKCICDMKCSLRLDECTCSIAGGAKEKRAFIRDLIREGKSNPEIMVLFNQKYGGLIE